MQSDLTTVANAIKQTADRRHEAATFDAGFDYGEYSHPASMRLGANETRLMLRAHGWTAVSFYHTMNSRVSPRWVHFNFPMEFVEQIIREDDEMRSASYYRSRMRYR